MASTKREMDRTPRMSEHEALMWTIEKDPWLNASGASLTLLDQPVDRDRFRRIMRTAVVAMPRLYERVVPGFGRLSTPAWAPDPEFDIDYHIREVELPSPGDEASLLEMAGRLYEEPLDRTRPLWRFVIINGLADGRGAIYSMLHHVIADGIGQIRMAELYQQLERDAKPPAEVDLEGIVASAVASAKPKESGGDAGDGVGDAIRDTAGHLVRRQVGMARRGLGEVVMWGADPKRMVDTVGGVAGQAAAIVRQVMPSASDDAVGSPLWTERSRHRRLEYVQLDLDRMKSASKAAGISINDLFLAGLADGGWRYHDARKTPVQAFNSSFVVSTRTDRKAGGNAFTPVPIVLPAGPLPLAERLRDIHARTETARESTSTGGGVGGFSGVLNQLPTSVLTRAARSASGRIDFATSNLRGAPFELFCAGARVEATICMGPVAGTGANITAMSYNGDFNIGLFVDPAAIEDPAAYREAVAASFADMLDELAPVTAQKPPATKRAAKKTTAKKTTATKTTAKKTRATKAKPAAPRAKKTTAKKTTAKKTTAKKSTAKKTTAKKARS